ncbi:MAG: sigma-70 family RNA polymerase sigma factor [Candidatus Gracilibacteria bacterium]|jgi:RNA polymerase sigma factor (sigma-70 family)|nr:sigma-70 family RNA polymerase sigma factor [Candidatus Gracilibacteria bacterium]
MDRENLAIIEKDRISSKNPDFDALNEEELWELKELGDQRVRDYIFMKHRKLVFFLLNKLYSRFLSDSRFVKDLEQEAFLGLLTAINKFDFKVGVFFSTYAQYWIRKFVDMFLERNLRVVRFPGKLQIAYLRINYLIQLHKLLHFEVPDNETLARISGISLKKIEKVIFFRSFLQDGALSLDAPVRASNRENGESRLDFMTDGTDFSMESDKFSFEPCFLEIFETRFKLYYKSSKKERDLEIFKLRFGFSDDSKEYTLEEIGERYNISRERARQVIEKMLSFIKKSDVLMDFLRATI